MFGTYHLLWLFGVIIAAFAGSLIYRSLHARGRRVFQIVFSAFMLITEVFKHIVLICTDSFSVGYLPLHLCSINMFLCMANAIKPGVIKQELLYAICMPGAAIALLFPNWVDMPIINFFSIHSFTIHVMLFILPIILLVNKEIKPSIKNLPKAILCVLAICPPMYLFNRYFGTNFMFLNRPGMGNPLVWFEKFLGNPGYLLGMPIIAAALWFVLYLPFAVTNKVNSKK